MKQNKIYIYGKHALMEALRHMPEAVERVFLADGGDIQEIRRAVEKAGVTISSLGSDKKSNMVSDSAAHQGVIGRISLEKLTKPYKEFMNGLDMKPDTALVLLGEVQDPHNVGAIIRSAAAFGVSGVLIPKHKQAPVTGTVVKVSAGMAFRVPLVEIGNVNSVISDLKEKGFWVYGLEGESEKTISDESFDKPSVFVLGNEGAGIREKTREACDMLLSVPINSRCESLNVAASTAVALYEWSSQHKAALEGK